MNKMPKTMPIDFVRQVLESELERQHKLNNKYFGGDNQINLVSFYEQLQRQEEVDRFVETYRDLVNQQNRTGLIGIGVVVAPENPTITNLYSATIIPMSWSCNLRCSIEDRDSMVETINNLINELKGTKVDIAEIKETGELFVVGTIGNHGEQGIEIQSGDFIGYIDTSDSVSVDTQVNDLIASLNQKGATLSQDFDLTSDFLYCYDYGENRLVPIMFDATVSPMTAYIPSENDIKFPPSGEIEKYKLSMSFDTIKIDEPYTLNSKEYLQISFGGSATIVSGGVVLGNDMVKISISKKNVVNVGNFPQNAHYLEPLEMPSGNNANTQLNQLLSNGFTSNTHTDTIQTTLQYSFVLDMEQPLLKQWFKYARYGRFGTPVVENNIISNDEIITPNIIYECKEIYSSWGEVEVETYLGKVVNNIDIENTEGDVLTLLITMQVQGENN